MEEPVQDPGPPCRREVQPGSARFPVRHEVGRVVPAEEDAASEVSAWELRELRERQEERGCRRRSLVPRRSWVSRWS